MLERWSPALRKVFNEVVGQGAKLIGKSFSLDFKEISDLYLGAIGQNANQPND
jgi:hypothetical protein